MHSPEIKISIRKILDYSESLQRTIDRKTLLLMIRSFSEYILNLYLVLIEEAIYSNRYKGEWEPVHDKGYREYLGVEPRGSIIEMIGDSLEVVKIGTNFIVRINPKVDYLGTDIPLDRVVCAIDRGTTKFNSRPILNRIVKDISGHMLDLWRGFLKIKGVL